MSSYSRNNNTAKTAAKPAAKTTKTKNTETSNHGEAYCKVCFDAGRPEQEYTSHYVKDQPGPQGKVICPTLLNQACRICAKTGHTSSYCPEYRSRRDEPRREDRYIARDEPRREDRYIARDEPRREDRYIAREEPRREDRYIAREEPRREYRYIARDEPRREDRYIAREEPRREDRRSSFNLLREDTERHERDLRNRDDSYYRQQERQSKPWLQAALKPADTNTRRAPYAHPHGPRVRLNLEAPALSAATVVVVPESTAPAIDVRKVNLHVKAKWGDEDNEHPFLFEAANPQQMAAEFFNGLTTEAEDKLITAFDNQSRLPWACSDDEN